MSQFYHGPSPSIPLHSAQIWAEGDAIRVALAGTIITLPKAGAKVQARGATHSALELALVSLLQSREANQSPRIAEMAEPTQAQVPDLSQAIIDAWKATDARKRAEAKREEAARKHLEARAFLADLGL